MLGHSNNSCHKAPSAQGPMATFLAGFVLLRLPPRPEAVALTTFSILHRAPVLSCATAVDGPFVVLTGTVFEAVPPVGLVAFARGIFVLRACMHMPGGAALLHVVAIIDALKTTPGICIPGIRPPLAGTGCRPGCDDPALDTTRRASPITSW